MNTKTYTITFMDGKQLVISALRVGTGDALVKFFNGWNQLVAAFPINRITSVTSE